jgi:hypothetical protein
MDDGGAADAAEAAAAAAQPASAESIGQRLLKLAEEPQPPSPDAASAPMFGRLGEQAMGRLGGAAAASAARIQKTLGALERTAANLENSQLMQRTKAVTQRGLAHVANAAENAALAASNAAANMKARRAAWLSARQFLESQAHARPVLPVVATCVHTLAATGLECEFIFSAPGSADAVQKLELMFKANPTGLLPIRAAPADVAAALKSYLKALPCPLLPFAPLSKAGYPDSRRALEALDAATPAGAATAELVLLLAGRLAQMSPATKMDAAKLARELAPCITRRQELPEGAPGDAAPTQAEEAAQDAAVISALRWMIAAGSKSSAALDQMELTDE